MWQHKNCESSFVKLDFEPKIFASTTRKIESIKIGIASLANSSIEMIHVNDVTEVIFEINTKNKPECCLRK